MVSQDAVAIFVPSLNRPNRLEALAHNIHEATPEPHKIYFMVSDYDSIQVLDKLGETYFVDSGGTWIERNNELLYMTNEPYIFLGSDDLKFTPGWYSAALKVMKEVDGVVPVNDLFNPNGTSALVSREYINTLSGCVDVPGVIAYPGYHHNYADTELFETAKFRKRFAYAADSVVEHLHWAAGKNQRDATYARSDEYTNKDAETFNSRRPLFT